MLKRIPIILASIAALALFTLPVTAAPSAQTTLPDFTLNAKTVISVTVAITDGQVIVVPVDLTFITQNRNGVTDVAVISAVEQQAGIFIGVAPSNDISATIELPNAPRSAAQATPQAQPQAITGAETHRANRNANLRAGPGTDFEIVGSLRAGDLVTIIGANDDGSWLQLDSGSWIAEFLVDPISDGNTADENADVANPSEDAGENDGANNQGPAGTPPVNADVPPAVGDQVALANYLLDLAAIGAGATDAVNSLTALMQNPEPLNPVWRDDVAAQLAVLSDALDQYLALTPVPGYEDLHSQVTEVALTCEQAVDTMVSGLENPRAIDPIAAAQSVQACAAQAADLAAVVETMQ